MAESESVMADFISDEEMAKLEASQKTPDFISDEEMANLEKGKSWYDISAQGLGKSALEALPIAGSIAGGLVGSAIAPIAGSVTGAGIGAAAGKSLEQAGKSLFFNEGPQTRGEQYQSLVQSGLEGAASEGGGQLVSKAMQGIIPLAKKAGPKIGQALTGISEQEIKTYAKNSDKIKEMAKASDSSTLEAADNMRKKFNDDISTKIKSINDNIKDILSTSKKEVESSPVYDALEKYKQKLNPNLHIEDIAQIEDIQKRILNASSGGKINVSLANDLKQYLQEKASSAYRNGDMFQIGKQAANAAKNAAAEARKLIDLAEPNVTKLNSTLSQFHTIEDSMNSNILKVGSPEAALMSAGTGGNARNVKALEQLGEMTGTPMLEEAQNLAAMRTFTNPPLLPIDTTGKSVARIGLGTTIGGAIGGTPGAIVGGALTSPMALKGIIDTSKKVSPIVEKVLPSKPTMETVYKSIMQKYLQNKPQKEEAPKIPDQGMIMKKVKGTPYEQILNNSLQKGQGSFAAANYVLQNRDQKYRELMSERES